MKYVGVLYESIQKELKLFKIAECSEASAKAIVIKEKNCPKKDKKGKKHVNVTQKNYCDHYNLHRHTKEQCWELHHELHPKRRKLKDDDSKKKEKKEKAILNAVKVEDLSELK